MNKNKLLLIFENKFLRENLDLRKIKKHANGVKRT